MTKNSSMKKQARLYQQLHDCTYHEAIRRTKYLKVGDRVKVHSKSPGVFAMGRVVFVNGQMITVKNENNGNILEVERGDIEYIGMPS